MNTETYIDARGRKIYTQGAQVIPTSTGLAIDLSGVPSGIVRVIIQRNGQTIDIAR